MNLKTIHRIIKINEKKALILKIIGICQLRIILRLNYKTKIQRKILKKIKIKTINKKYNKYNNLNNNKCIRYQIQTI